MMSVNTIGRVAKEAILLRRENDLGLGIEDLDRARDFLVREIDVLGTESGTDHDR
jgi:hypothetical protein